MSSPTSEKRDPHEKGLDQDADIVHFNKTSGDVSRRDSAFSLVDSRPSSCRRLETGQSGPSTTSTLLELPADILMLLSDFLPAASIVSLRLTCRALRTSTNPPSKPRNNEMCTRAAISRYRDEREDAKAGKHCCALCKATYNDDLFRKAAILEPAFSFVNFASAQLASEISEHRKTEQSGREISTSPSTLDSDARTIPTPRICAWHINRFVFPASATLTLDAAFNALVTSATARHSSYHPDPDADKVNAAFPTLGNLKASAAAVGWASSVEQACMHCGCVVVCVCSVGDCGICECDHDCQSCGVRQVRCWWRLARSGLGPRHEKAFRIARQKWLVARAEEMSSFGWDGKGLALAELLDWGLVRVVKCAGAERTSTAAASSRKRGADSLD